MNPLFQLMGSNNNGNMMNMISQFQKFKKNFSGDPKQMIQEMLNSGKISQADYDAAVQQAKELQKMLGM